MAPRKCTVCNHEDRPTIDAEMVQAPGTNLAIAERWGLSKDAVRRHRAHLSPAIKAAITRREKTGAQSAVDRLYGLIESAEAVLDREEEARDSKKALGAIRELRGLVELLAKLTGELDERPTVQVLNVATSPQWTELRGIVLRALSPFPEAARAVSAALLALETGRDRQVIDA